MSEELITKTEARLDSHEELCALRYEAINARLKRLENILIGVSGFLLAAFVGVALKLPS